MLARSKSRVSSLRAASPSFLTLAMVFITPCSTEACSRTRRRTFSAKAFRSSPVTLTSGRISSILFRCSGVLLEREYLLWLVYDQALREPPQSGQHFHEVGPA